jgi:hypothetical protein
MRKAVRLNRVAGVDDSILINRASDIFHTCVTDTWFKHHVPLKLLAIAAVALTLKLESSYTDLTFSVSDFYKGKRHAASRRAVFYIEAEMVFRLDRPHKGTIDSEGTLKRIICIMST